VETSNSMNAVGTFQAGCWQGLGHARGALVARSTLWEGRPSLETPMHSATGAAVDLAVLEEL
jgi:hypothetical protein